MNDNKMLFMMAMLALGVIVGIVVVMFGEDDASEIDWLEDSRKSPLRAESSAEPQREKAPKAPKSAKQEVVEKDPKSADDANRSTVPDPLDNAPPLGFKGRVVAEGKRSIAGARLRLIQGPGVFLRRPGTETGNGALPVSGPDGMFFVEAGESAMPYTLEIVHPDYLTVVRSDLFVAEGTVDLGDIALSRGAVVEGMVLGPDGRGMAGASVWAGTVPTAGPGDISLALRRFAQSTRSVRSGPDGGFRLGGLEAGNVTIYAAATGYSEGQSEEIALEEQEVRTRVVVNLGMGLSLTGAVVSDLGWAIQEAQVTLTPNRSHHPSQAAITIPSQQSDERGRFHFRGIGKGLYTLEAEAEGFSPFKRRGVRAGTEDVLVELQRVGSLRGRVRSAREGSPVMGFSLELEKARGRLDHEVYRQTDPVTDRDGPDNDTFIIAGLEPGVYRVVIEADGFGRGYSKRVVVEPGAMAEGVEVLLAAEASLQGRVVEKGTGTPLGGVRLRAQTPLNEADSADVSKRNLLADASRRSQSTTSEEDGTFKLGHLSAGVYEIRVSDGEHVDLQAGPYRLGDGETRDDLVLELAVGGRIEGTIRDLENEPVEGDTVMAIGPLPSRRTYRTRSDASGFYSMARLAPGTYSVRRAGASSSTLPGELSTLGRLMGSGNSSKDAVEVSVVDGEATVCDFSDLDLGTIEGRIAWSGGAVQGAMIEIRQKSRASMMPYDSTQTDEHGHYSFDRVKPGDYQVEVRTAHSGLPHIETANVESGKNRLDIALPGGGISGKAIVEGEGTPLEAVIVRVRQAGAEESTSTSLLDRGQGGREKVSTDANGRFEFQFLPPGRYIVSFEHTTHVARSDVEVQVAPDQQAKGVTGAMIAGGELRGQVVSPSGKAMGGVWITVRNNGELVEHAFVDSEGRFHLRGIEPGTYDVKVSGRGFVDWERRLEIHPRTSELRVQLESDG